MLRVSIAGTASAQKFVEAKGGGDQPARPRNAAVPSNAPLCRPASAISTEEDDGWAELAAGGMPDPETGATG